MIKQNQVYIEKMTAERQSFSYTIFKKDAKNNCNYIYIVSL